MLSIISSHALKGAETEGWIWGVLIQYVKGVPSIFYSGTHRLHEELGRHDNRGGSQECPNCEACKELVEHVMFECAACNS